MNRIIVVLSLFAAAQGAVAQEELSRREALKFAFYVSADLKVLQGTPIATDVDLKHPVVLHDGDYGAMVLPEAKLSPETVAKAGDTVVPIGQLWLRKLTPLNGGEGVQGSKLRTVSIETESETASAVQCALGVKGDGSGGLELLVFGKDKNPVAKVPLKKIQGSQQHPIAMKAERTDEAGRLTLTILGRYEARLMVTELQE